MKKKAFNQLLRSIDEAREMKKKENKLRTMKESQDILMTKTLNDWMILRDAIASCGIEGIRSERLNSYVDRWFGRGERLNRKELDWLSRFMDGTLNE